MKTALKGEIVHVIQNGASFGKSQLLNGMKLANQNKDLKIAGVMN